MTDIEIDIAIAELCGWTRIRTCEDSHGIWVEGLNPDYGRHPSNGIDQIINYNSDLGAIVAEVHKWVGFSAERARKYSDNLMRVIQDRRGMSSAVDARYMSSVALADEHCEAFLRLNGKWKE